MGFLDKLFGKKEKGYVDERGIYFTIECSRCNNRLRVRADRQYDLNQTESGYLWRKTIVCDNCFTQIPAEIKFDGKYNVTGRDIEKGQFIAETDTADGTRGFG